MFSITDLLAQGFFDRRAARMRPTVSEALPARERHTPW